MNPALKLGLAMFLITASAPSIADEPNNPNPGPRPRVSYRYEEWNLAKLQRDYAKGVADPVPWIGYWWPYTEDGIADDSYDKDKMGPSDKLDKALGNSNWVTGWEMRNHGTARNPADWWGHCNGWATAAIMEPEPRKARTVNGVTFEVRDRKAILSEYWLQSGADFIGSRVWNSGDTTSAAFWDVVPAQYYLAMTNILGRHRRSMIVDRYTGAEVWNQPMVAYEMHPIKPEDYLGRDPRYTNLYRVNVTSDMWWGSDEVEPDDLTPKFEWKETDAFVKRTLKFELWVDAPLEFDSKGRLVSSGDIVLTRNGTGGRWKNGTTYEALVDSHPDFLWLPLSYARSTGYKNPRLNDAWVNKHLSEGSN